MYGSWTYFVLLQEMQNESRLPATASNEWALLD